MRYLRDKAAAQYLSVGVSTIWLYTKQHKIKAIKLSERVTVWSTDELDAFVQRQMQSA